LSEEKKALSQSPPSRKRTRKRQADKNKNENETGRQEQERERDRQTRTRTRTRQADKQFLICEVMKKEIKYCSLRTHKTNLSNL
jgi:5-deoxy-D-glucuronate isomerase